MSRKVAGPPLLTRRSAGRLLGAAGAALCWPGGPAHASGGEQVSLALSDGREVSARLHRAEAPTPAPAVLLIHEWWGLTDTVDAAAADLAARGINALAVDLMGGRTAATPEAARALIETVDPTRARETLVRWRDWLADEVTTGDRIGALGWGFGGGWALAAALAAPLRATVVYYGRVNRPASELAALQGPVLGHFAQSDPFIDQTMVAEFVAAMSEAGRALTVYWYEADHAFANPTGSAYDAEAAALAWERTTSFLAQALQPDG